jgi:lipoprotein-releasing system ATP-binding protein
MALLTEINKDDRTGFLISTHDEKIAGRCRRQVYMVDGKVADDRQQG